MISSHLQNTLNTLDEAKHHKTGIIKKNHLVDVGDDTVQLHYPNLVRLQRGVQPDAQSGRIFRDKLPQLGRRLHLLQCGFLRQRRQSGINHVDAIDFLHANPIDRDGQTVVPGNARCPEHPVRVVAQIVCGQDLGGFALDRVTVTQLFERVRLIRFHCGNCL